MMKFHCRATEFLHSVYLIYLNQYLPAIQTLRRPKNNLNLSAIFFSQLQSNSSLTCCEKTCPTGPLEYKYRVIFVLVLGVICTLRGAVG